MMSKFIFILLAAVTCRAANISTSKSKFVTTTTPEPDEDLDQGDPFQYSYAVEAEPTVNDTRVRQSKAESSDGQEVVGQYKVLLPDGRLQTVSYTSGPNGYKATVKYVQVGVDSAVVSSSTESNGRSFTVSRGRTIPPTTTTTTTTSTTTSAPIVVDETVDVRQPAQTKQRQQQSELSIDSRTSTSSRSRQRSNRTRGGERFRSPQETTASVAVSSKTTADITMMTPASGKADDATRIDLTATARSRSSATSFGMKTAWKFDANR